jgi:hypothetical protein
MSNRNSFAGWRSPWEWNHNASSTVDTAAALMGLRESGFEEQPWELERTAMYLREAQLPSGGWPYVIGTDEPTTAATAWALRSLVREGHPISDDWAQRALQWLLLNQHSDGGWGVNLNVPFSTIGKTRDALLALSLFAEAEKAIGLARNWLLNARASSSTPEDFGQSVAVEPHGGNPTVESVVYFLEAAFAARIPPAELNVRADLEWLARKRWWGYTPQAMYCLSQYRKWVT